MQLLHSSIADVSIVRVQHLTMLVSTQTNSRQEHMAYYNTTTGHSGLLERILGTAANFLNQVAEHHAKRRVYNNTKLELSALTGRELADLGILPCEINRIAREAAYGPKAQ